MTVAAAPTCNSASTPMDWKNSSQRTVFSIVARTLMTVLQMNGGLRSPRTCSLTRLGRFTNEHIPELNPAVLVLQANRAAGRNARERRLRDHFLPVQRDCQAVATHADPHPVPISHRAICRFARRQRAPQLGRNLPIRPVFPHLAA